MVDWADEGKLPNKIWGFVDLRGLPERNRLHYAGIWLKQGVYAVVESSIFVEDEEREGLSKIFVPITKVVGGMVQNMVSQLKFYLADVEAIVQPIAVIPEIGGQTNNYFYVKDQETWRKDFMDWLESDLDVRKEILGV